MDIGRNGDAPLSILLIEDNPGDARLFEELVEESGLAAAVRGERTLGDGLEALSGREVDVVVVDLGLPDAEGLESVERCTEAAPGTAVVVLTGRQDHETAAAALDVGAVQYLEKAELTPRLVARTLWWAVDRHALTRKLHRSEERFRSVAESASDGLLSIDTESRIVYANPAAHEIFGHEPGELTGESLHTLIPEEYRDRHREGLESYLQTGESRLDWSDVEMPALRADGSRFRAQISFGEYEVEGERFFTGIVRDVTERVERQRELERATASFRERVKEQSCLYDVSRLLHTDDRDLDARLGAVAERLPEGWQYPEVTAARLELGERSWSSPGFSETGPTLSASIRVSGNETGRVTVCYMEERPEEDIGPFLQDEQELLLTIAEQVAVAVDRKRTRRELEAERERLAEVFENAPSWVATLRGPDHVFEMVNPAYYQLVGDRDVVGLSVREVFPDLEDEGYFELLDHVYETGETVEVAEKSLPLETEQGSEQRYISFVYQPRRQDGEVVGVTAHGVDVTEQVERREQVREAEEKWATALELAPVGIAITHPETAEYFSVNQACAWMLDRDPEEMVGRTAYDLGFWHDPDHRDEFLAELQEGGAVRNELMQFETSTGEVRDGRLSVNALELGGEDRLVWTLQDVTDERAREAQYRTLVDTMAEATLMFDRDGRITFANAEAEELLGLDESELADRAYDDPDWRITAPDGAPFPDENLPFRRVRDTGRPVRNVEHGLERPDGGRRIVSVNAAPVMAGSGDPEGAVATIRDVTDRKKMEQQLRHRALHDPLTGLANRTLLSDRVDQGMAQARRREENLGLVMLDVVRFGRVNDRLGHTAGDRVLRELARRLEATTREQDTVARWGGDEFVLVLPNLDGPDGFASCWERIERAVEMPFEAKGESVPLDVCAGALLQGGDGARGMVEVDDAEELLRYGDLALQEAKEQEAGTLRLFDPSEQLDGIVHLRRERELRRGIEDGEFVPHYQPVVRLDSGDAVGVEALARWEHPDEGLLSPGVFLPLAEELGLIRRLGNGVIRLACREAAGWGNGRLADRPFSVSVNLSGQQLEHEGLPGQLRGWLQEVGLPADRVVLEVTETSVMRSPAAVEELRDLGTQVYLDDFGTGYSTFSYLRDLKLDGIKVDRSFVKNLGRSREDEALVSTMVGLADKLGLDLVAEGIETEEQREKLLEMGCRFGQGYLFDRPMSGSEIQTRLE